MKMLAAFIAFIIVLALPISLLIYDVARVVFSPEIMSDLLTTRLVESGVIRGFITDSLLSPESLQEQGPGEFDFSRVIENLSPEERGAIVDILIPPEWIEEQISASFNAIYFWIDDDRPLPLIHLDMAPIKERLLGGGVIEVVDTIVDSWPSCSAAQMEHLREVVEFGGEFPAFLCEPPEPFRSKVINLISSQLIQMVREVPSELSLSGDQPYSQDMADIAAMKEWIRLARVLSRSSWLLPIALLGLVMALAVRSWGELGRWWGIPLLIGGVLTLLLAVLVTAVGEVLLTSQLSDLKREAEAVYGLLMVIIGSLKDVIIGSLLFHAALVSVIGLVLLVGGWLISRRTSSLPPGQPGAIQPSMGSVETSGSVSPPIPASPPPPVPPMPEDETVIEDEG